MLEEKTDETKIFRRAVFSIFEMEGRCFSIPIRSASNDADDQLLGKYASIYVQITARCSRPRLSNRAHAENSFAAETSFRKLQCIRSAKLPTACVRFARK